MVCLENANRVNILPKRKAFSIFSHHMSDLCRSHSGGRRFNEIIIKERFDWKVGEDTVCRHNN